ncbi:MACRO domain-containing protein 2 [Termitomyces sp. J132]|nr:MACRO domain-containing protein 2 [Termitomyces sp. J132]
MLETEQSTTDQTTSNLDESSNIVRLAKIPTIAERYKKSTLEAAVSDKILYQPNSALLERISIYQGDITRVEVDSIVNAANKSLLVDGAIHHAAGPRLLEECRTLNGCMTGNSKITRGYCLPARYVIHTVGPVYSPDAAEEKARQLASCYRTSLEVAVENQVRHVVSLYIFSLRLILLNPYLIAKAFPSVSTGIYGYPIVDATRVALDQVRRFVESEPGKTLERVVFVVWGNKDLEAYESLVPEYFPPRQEESEKNNDVDTNSKDQEV